MTEKQRTAVGNCYQKAGLTHSPDVLLLLPPLYQTGREPDYNPKEPMGLMCLASELRRNNVDVEILDADIETLPLGVTVERIIKEQPKILGISVLQRALPSTETIVETLKEHDGNRPFIVLGGITATLSHESVLRRLKGLIDCLVLGEGEVTLTELSRRVLSGQEWRRTPGIAFLDDDKVVVSSLPRKIEPAAFPKPARDYLDFCLQKSGYGTVLSSRGCYGHCSFCANFSFESFSNHGSRWRGREPEAVVDEIVQVRRESDTRVWKFNDPNLFGPGIKGRRHVEGICQEIIARDLDLSLMAFCRGNDILANPDLLPIMKQAGFERLLIGVESSVDSVLDHFHKDETIEGMEEAIDLVQNQGMSVVPGFMIFHPYTTKETCLQDLAFLRRWRFTPTLAKALRVFDGTPIQGQLEEEGRLIARNPFEGYHEYTMPPDIAAVYMAMKQVSVAWIDTLRKHYQDRIWQIKKGPSFHERTGFYSLSELLFSLEVGWLETLLGWTDNGFSRGEINRRLDGLWEKGFGPVLQMLGVENQKLFTSPRVLSGQVFQTLQEKPFNTFPEEYRWQED